MEQEARLTLYNFRNEVEEEVLQRGWLYFNSGWVKEPRELMPDYFEARVEEVNPHAVSFSWNDDESFTDIFCTCGDTSHTICRHMAAVLFWYENDLGITRSDIDEAFFNS